MKSREIQAESNINHGPWLIVIQYKKEHRMASGFITHNHVQSLLMIPEIIWYPWSYEQKLSMSVTNLKELSHGLNWLITMTWTTLHNFTDQC